jgi:hypothetical protein
MIIDTDRIRKRLENYYSKRSAAANRNIKDHQAAVRVLNGIEQESEQDYEMIDRIEELEREEREETEREHTMKSKSKSKSMVKTKTKRKRRNRGIPFEVGRFADVTTGHMTRQDCLLLEGGAKSVFLRSTVQTARSMPDSMTYSGPIVYAYAEGFFVHVSNEKEYLEEGLTFASNGIGFSDQFKRIMREAHRQKLWFVRFDADGADYDRLETFAWL